MTKLTSKIEIIEAPTFRKYRTEATARKNAWAILKRLRNKTVSNYLEKGGDRFSLRYFEMRGNVTISD